MTLHPHEAACRRIVDEILTKGDYAKVPELYDDDATFFDPSHGDRRSKAGEVQAVNELYRRAFPDLAYEVVDSFCSADKVMLQLRVSGTHQGVFLGSPPTGKPFSIGGFINIRMKDGKVIEATQLYDTFGLFQQLGLLPDPSKSLSAGPQAALDFNVESALLRRPLDELDSEAHR